MFKRLSSALIIFILGLTVIWPGTTGARDNKPVFNHEIIVKFKNEASKNTLYKKTKDKVVSTSKQLNFQVVKVTGQSIQAAMKEYQKNPNVAYVEPNYRVQASFIPNDPDYESQYSLKKVQAEEAWDITQGSEEVTIAIVDTGVDYTHPDLEGKVVKGYDFVDNDDDPMDENMHGTHCAGVAAASTHNEIGIAGMAPHVKILAERVLDKYGSGSYAGVANGITHAVDAGAHIISLSLGGPSSSTTLEEAVRYADENGVVILAAAGNSGDSSASYPAYYSQVISVAATDKEDKLANFSNYGDWVDVAAPGVDIYSTVPGGKYQTLSGTSMATPLVAGIAGLLISEGRDAHTVRDLIENTTDDIGISELRHGRVNALKALQ